MNIPTPGKNEAEKKIIKETQPRVLGEGVGGGIKVLSLAWPLKLYSLIETLLIKMSDFYEDGIKPFLPTDSVEVSVAESFGCKKKATQEILEGHERHDQLLLLSFVPLVWMALPTQWT